MGLEVKTEQWRVQPPLPDHMIAVKHPSFWVLGCVLALAVVWGVVWLSLGVQ